MAGMSRPCTTCQHLKRPEIDRRLAAGEPSTRVARDYELNASSLHRHRINCLNSAHSSRGFGIKELQELPQGLFGSPRASALAAIDRVYYSNTLIIADLSNDATYAEVLFETFGQRVIGLHISRGGDGGNLSGGQ